MIVLVLTLVFFVSLVAVISIVAGLVERALHIRRLRRTIITLAPMPRAVAVAVAVAVPTAWRRARQHRMHELRCAWWRS